MTSDRDAYYAKIRELARAKREEFSVRTDALGLKEINGIYRREKIKIDTRPLSSRLKALYMCSDNSYSVAIREKLPKTPKLFALVHELKHHWADRHLMEQGILTCGSYNENELIEKAAEVFAAEFIYPEGEFSEHASCFMEDRKIRTFCIDDVVHFKRQFCKAKVSYTFIRKRLQWLNLAASERLDGAQFQKREDELYGAPIHRQPWFKERLKAKRPI
ncbi:MAG TPA: ImmA/IrrE family metallo-endopeptidase [Xanthobacteraceae bacterium]|nr:ImmA/IrrE family metallo-endopeptidase [Xanthobacteraceae bacterium]